MAFDLIRSLGSGAIIFCCCAVGTIATVLTIVCRIDLVFDIEQIIGGCLFAPAYLFEIVGLIRRPRKIVLPTLLFATLSFCAITLMESYAVYWKFIKASSGFMAFFITNTASLVLCLMFFVLIFRNYYTYKELSPGERKVIEYGTTLPTTVDVPEPSSEIDI